MAINQSQVDHIISSASADDPEVKLQNLQDEVDLLKKSVKKLLIDLRERLNETENPFIVSTVATVNTNAAPAQLPKPEDKTVPISDKYLDKKEENAEKKEEEDKSNEHKIIISTVSAEEEEKKKKEKEEKEAADAAAQQNAFPQGQIFGQQQAALSAGMNPYADKNSLNLLKQQIADIEKNALDIPEYTLPQNRPKLQKLHSLFEWVGRMVKKYGHDRLVIMIDSYCSMRYITEDVGRQVKEISKLMPDSIGEEHEISSEEFVSELYVLNRIIAPEDSSLDREMIEVMMDKKDQRDIKPFSSETDDLPSEEDWIKMLERV